MSIAKTITIAAKSQQPLVVNRLGNRLIAEALYPYPADLVICTKVGATRKPDKLTGRTHPC